MTRLDHFLDEFLEHDYSRVVRTVTVACGDGELAADAVQNALAAALDSERRGRHIDNLPAWVITVALNSNKRRFRRSAMEARSLARVAPLQRDSEAAVDAAFVDMHAAVLALPLRQRQAVVLHYLHDLDIATIADQLGVREGTVKTALFRARQALAESLNPPAVTRTEKDHA